MKNYIFMSPAPRAVGVWKARLEDGSPVPLPEIPGNRTLLAWVALPVGTVVYCYTTRNGKGKRVTRVVTDER